MPRILLLGLALAAAVSCSIAGTHETWRQLNSAAQNHDQAPGTVSLKICLRLSDGTPFTGLADLHLTSNEGREMPGESTGTEGEALFTDLLPGKYTAEASAPGFQELKRDVGLTAEQDLEVLFLVFKPQDLSSLPPKKQATQRPDGPNPEEFSWVGTREDVSELTTAPNVACALPSVLEGVSRQMTEFVSGLDKFSATERVEHFQVDKKGRRERRPSVRSFDYVASISRTSSGQRFILDEYRDGSVDNSRFPGGIATTGLPAMALLFHPLLSSDFQFGCEGLAQWNGRPAWLVSFEQRKDRPVRLRAYVMGEHHFAIPLKGHAWIDAATLQVLRLESDLAKPVSAISLTREHLDIEYAPVRFRTEDTQLWLPQTADIYVEQGKHRYYRSHTFSGFRVFVVDVNQDTVVPPGSYCFTNTTDQDVTGTLTVHADSQQAFHVHPNGLNFTIFAKRRICKFVGPGKDVAIPADSVESATFVHSGAEGAVKVDASLLKESTLDIVAERSDPVAQ